MSAASSNGSVPPFTAWPVAAKDDATAYLYPTELTTPGGPDTGTDYAAVSAFLAQPQQPPTAEAEGQVAPWGLPSSPMFVGSGQVFAGGPRMSAAGEVQLKLRADAKTAPVRTARGLVCRADRNRAVSVTLRSVTGADPVAADQLSANSPFTAASLARLFKPEFKASGSRNPGKKPVWFSVADQVGALYRAIFETGRDAGRPTQGLVVVTGATNSAKTQITRGLIHRYLEARLEESRASTGVRRPHLVTFEDPIEAFLYRPLDATDLDKDPDFPTLLMPGAGPIVADAIVCHKWLSELPRPLVAQWHGYDYTPREKGKDVRDLAQGFSDALRQTPAVYFVGEVRDVKDWAAVLDFAGTGHLVVTTAHAGSLLEAMIKILTAVGADTAADRRRYASRIKAVVHLRPWMATYQYEPPLPFGSLWSKLVPDFFAGCANLLLPSVWRFTEPGLASLSTNGFGAVMPMCPPGDDRRTSCLGRQWFARELCSEVDRGTGGRLVGWTRPTAGATKLGWSPTADEVDEIERTMRRWAARADLNRE